MKDIKIKVEKWVKQFWEKNIFCEIFFGKKKIVKQVFWCNFFLGEKDFWEVFPC